MDDPRAWRDDAEVLERLLGPAQQRVSLPVTLHLLLDVQAVRRCGSEKVDLDGVVDHQVGWNNGVDARGVPAHGRETRTHGGEVDDRGHAGEVLQDDPRGHKRKVRAGVGGTPGGHGAHVPFAYVSFTGVSEDVLEQDADGERETIERGDSLRLEGLEAVERGRTLAQVECSKGTERVLGRVGHGLFLRRWNARASEHRNIERARVDRHPGTPRRPASPRGCLTALHVDRTSATDH